MKQQRQIKKKKKKRARSAEETGVCSGTDLLITDTITWTRRRGCIQFSRRMRTLTVRIRERNILSSVSCLSQAQHPHMTRWPCLFEWWARSPTCGKMLSHSSWSPRFGCVNISRWARGPSVAPLSPEPRERSLSSGVSKHKNAENLFGRRDELQTSVKGPPMLHACQRSNGAPKEMRISQ